MSNRKTKVQRESVHARVRRAATDHALGHESTNAAIAFMAGVKYAAQYLDERELARMLETEGKHK